MDALLPEGLGAGAASVLVLAAAGTSFLTAAVGLGGGVALLAVMGLLVPPALLVPVHGIVQLGSNAGRAALLARSVSRAALGPFLAGAVVGVAAGGWLVALVPPAAVQGAVAAFVLWSVLGGRALAPATGWAAGAVSSALTMWVGATGPFVMAWVRGLGLERTGTVATHAALMTAQHGLKVAAFGLIGVALAPWAALTAAMIAAGFLGTLAGRQVLLRTPEVRFRRVLDVLLCLAAAGMLWQAIAALDAGAPTP